MLLPSSLAIPADGEPLDLGTLGGNHAQALDLNDRGQVVGLSATIPGQDSAPLRAFLWEDGQMQDLGTLGNNSIARGINNLGMVVGSSAASGEEHAFVWYRGHMLDLGTLGGNLSRANAVNERGQIVGFSRAADGNEYTVIWEVR